MAGAREKVKELRDYISCDPQLVKAFRRTTKEILHSPKGVSPLKAQKAYRKLINAAVYKTVGRLKASTAYPADVRDRLALEYAAHLFKDPEMAQQNPRGREITRAGYSRSTCKKYKKVAGKRKCVKKGPKTKVKATRIRDVGRPGKGSKADVYVKVKRPGSLGGDKYTDKSATERRKILLRCERRVGTGSCRKKLGAMLLWGGFYNPKPQRSWSNAKLNKVASDYNWFAKKYGDPDWKRKTLLR